MIRYALRCANDHRFESWFRSAAGYDALVESGQVNCPDCGSREVSKALMAPSVSSEVPVSVPALARPSNPREAALAALRRKVETDSEYVGPNFATEARAIHDGEAPERSIWGEARPDEAKALIEDGIPVAPLPFLPAGKVN